MWNNPSSAPKPQLLNLCRVTSLVAARRKRSGTMDDHDDDENADDRWLDEPIPISKTRRHKLKRAIALSYRCTTDQAAAAVALQRAFPANRFADALGVARQPSSSRFPMKAGHLPFKAPSRSWSIP